MRLRPRRGKRDLSKTQQVVNVHYVSSSSHHHLFFLFRMSWPQKELGLFFKILIRDCLVACLVPYPIAGPCLGHVAVTCSQGVFPQSTRGWELLWLWEPASPLTVPGAPQIPHPQRGPQRSLHCLEWFPFLPHSHWLKAPNVWPACSRFPGAIAWGWCSSSKSAVRIMKSQLGYLLSGCRSVPQEPPCQELQGMFLSGVKLCMWTAIIPPTELLAATHPVAVHPWIYLGFLPVKWQALRIQPVGSCPADIRWDLERNHREKHSLGSMNS